MKFFKWIVLPVTDFSCVAFVFSLQFLWWPLESGFGWIPVFGLGYEFRKVKLWVKVALSRVFAACSEIDLACQNKAPKGDFFTFKNTKLSQLGGQKVTSGQAFKGGKSFGKPEPHFNSKMCLVRAYLRPPACFRCLGADETLSARIFRQSLPLNHVQPCAKAPVGRDVLPKFHERVFLCILTGSYRCFSLASGAATRTLSALFRQHDCLDSFVFCRRYTTPIVVGTLRQ